MAKAKVLEAKDFKVGGEAGTAVLHRAVVAEEANNRQGTQSAKTRGETRGGGRKPYRQKKTGRARQGSIRSPHYAHGGMALAVKPRDYTKKVNRKERRLALKTAFAAKVAAGDVLLVDAVSFDAPKTKEAAAFVSEVAGDVKRVLVIIAEYSEPVYKSFRNLRNGKVSVEVRTAPASVKRGEEGPKTQAFSTRDLLLANKVIVSKDALKAIEGAWA